MKCRALSTWQKSHLFLHKETPEKPNVKTGSPRYKGIFRHRKAQNHQPGRNDTLNFSADYKSADQVLRQRPTSDGSFLIYTHPPKRNWVHLGAFFPPKALLNYKVQNIKIQISFST
jgi:hypothetical protein